VKNLPSFGLLVGYSGYTAMQHSLHSVQTRRDKKEWGCIYVWICFKAIWNIGVLSLFSLYFSNLLVSLITISKNYFY